MQHFNHRLVRGLDSLNKFFLDSQFETLVGWSGTYRIEGGNIIINVDASWTEVWTGKDQIRHWTLSGNRLTLTADPQSYPRDTSKTVIVRQVWEKVE